MANDQNNDAPAAFYFKVLVEGIKGKYEAGFKEVSGLAVKLETEAIEEGGETRFKHKLPSAKYSNLVLKRGLVTGPSFITWINDTVQNFKIEPKTVTVMLMSAEGLPLVSWTFHNAYPVSVSVSDMGSAENKYAIDTLELAYSYFTRIEQ